MPQAVILKKFSQYLDIVLQEYINELKISEMNDDERKHLKDLTTEELTQILKDKELKNDNLIKKKNEREDHINKMKKALDDGHCFGFSLTHGAMDLAGKLNWWKNVLVKLNNWDGLSSSLKIEITNLPGSESEKTTLDTLFDRGLNYVIGAHAHSKSEIRDYVNVSGTHQENILNPGIGIDYTRVILIKYGDDSPKIMEPDGLYLHLDSNNHISVFNAENKDSVTLSGEQYKNLKKVILESRLRFPRDDNLEITNKNIINDIKSTLGHKPGIFEILVKQGDKESIQYIRTKKTVGGNFSATDFDHLLTEENVLNKICLIESDTHSIRVKFDGTHWSLYDPNYRHNRRTNMELIVDKKYKAYVIDEIFQRLKTHSLHIQLASIKRENIDFSNIKSTGTELLQDKGLYHLALASSDLLNKILSDAIKNDNELLKIESSQKEKEILRVAEIKKENEVFIANLANGLMKESTSGKYTGLYMMARYSPDSLTSLLKIAKQHKEIRSAIEKVLAEQLESGTTVLHTMATNAPIGVLTDLFEIARAPQQKEMRFSIAKALNSKTTEGMTGLDRIGKYEDSALHDLLNLAMTDPDNIIRPALYMALLKNEKSAEWEINKFKNKLNQTQFGEPLDLTGQENLSSYDLSWLPLERANLSSMNLHQLNLQNLKINEINLENSNLSKSDFSLTQLVRANLKNTDLRDANMQFSDMSNAILFKANLTGADLRNVNLNDAVISADQLKSAAYIENIQISKETLDKNQFTSDDIKDLKNKMIAEYKKRIDDCNNVFQLTDLMNKLINNPSHFLKLNRTPSYYNYDEKTDSYRAVVNYSIKKIVNIMQKSQLSATQLSNLRKFDKATNTSYFFQSELGVELDKAAEKIEVNKQLEEKNRLTKNTKT